MKRYLIGIEGFGYTWNNGKLLLPIITASNIEEAKENSFSKLKNSKSSLFQQLEHRNLIVCELKDSASFDVSKEYLEWKEKSDRRIMKEREGRERKLYKTLKAKFEPTEV